jgi:EAL domain-containing protein (putative c-di-GMP-specific phosphodiesterase class I)
LALEVFKFSRKTPTVRALGVDYVQGYYLGRPMPLADLDFEQHRPAELAPVR